MSNKSSVANPFTKRYGPFRFGFSLSVLIRSDSARTTGPKPAPGKMNTITKVIE